MARYIANFKKVVYGYAVIEAMDLEEAKKNFEEEKFDEIDNVSDYEWEEIKKD